MKLSIEQLIYSNLIKYEYLMNIINVNFENSDSDKVNVYIDLTSLLKSLYSNIDVSVSDYNTIASCVINTGGHYRHFFYKYYNTYANIFFVYSDNTPMISKMIYNEYNKSYINTVSSKVFMTKLINDNLLLIDGIVPYIPNAYLINIPNQETSVIINHLINITSSNGLEHIVISKDPYSFQLVNNNALVLRPKRSIQGYYLNKSNAVYNYIDHVRKYNKPINAYPELLPLLYTLTSFPERNIHSIGNITKGIKTLEYIMSNGIILESDFIYNYKVIESLYPKLDMTTFSNRFKLLSLPIQYSIFNTNINNINIRKNIINKYDPNGVKLLNEKYFKTMPIDLGKILY